MDSKNSVIIAFSTMVVTGHLFPYQHAKRNDTWKCAQAVHYESHQKISNIVGFDFVACPPGAIITPIGNS